jgi:hypothetical protein
MKYFTIYGERCSGTNYLKELMLKNFKIDVTKKYGHKHFFGFHDFIHDDDENNTLFIGIIRNPVEWLNSFYKEKHHIPEENKKLYYFLHNEFYSVWPDNVIISEDLHYETKQKYKNIFEMRKCKNDFLMNIMPTKVKNYILIRYEDLRDNTIHILEMIQNKFSLEVQKKEEPLQNITYYKDIKNIVYNKKEVTFSKYMIDKIIKNVNQEQEKKLGYDLF